MDRKRQKLTPEKNDVQRECQDAKITALEKKLEHMEKKLKLNDVQKECQDEKITALERKFEHMENKLKLVIAELEQVKEERARDKINFETEKCELESKIDKYKGQCAELQNENENVQSENEKLQSENKRLQKYLQDLESANINVEERSQKTLTYNPDLTSQITKVLIGCAEAMADSRDIVELEETIEKMNVELSQSHTNVSELDVKVKEQEEGPSIAQDEMNNLREQNARLATDLKEIKESIDDALDINSLPNEMILKIFGYLEQNQLGQIARVCSRWNVLTRSPALWKNVDVKFHWSHKSHNTMTRCFVNMLPSCVTSIRLYYTNLDWTEQLNFEELCVRLQRRCPHLEMLILEHVNLSDNFPSVIGLCNQFLPGVKILIFRHSRFSDSPTKSEFDGISKIEVLDVSDCNLREFQELQFLKMPQLRVLNLRNTGIGPIIFRTLQNHGHNLEELYLCGTFVSADDLKFSNSVFPHLKIICLHCELVTCNAIVSVIQSCQSLQKVYSHEFLVKKYLIFHPFFESNRCKYNIVEGVDEHHSHNLEYSYK